jgi:hypothetical protein
MARQDEIFKSFLKHEILRDKYGVTEAVIPNNLQEGLRSEIVIIKTIAYIVDSVQKPIPTTDKSLREEIIQYLNQKA